MKLLFFILSPRPTLRKHITHITVIRQQKKQKTNPHLPKQVPKNPMNKAPIHPHSSTQTKCEHHNRNPSKAKYTLGSIQTTATLNTLLLIFSLAFIVSSANAVCISPINPFGYDSSSKTENNLNVGCDFSVINWKCITGFSGQAIATACSSDGEPYKLSGCTPISNTFCQLQGPSSCRGTLHEFLLDESSALFPTGPQIFTANSFTLSTSGRFQSIDFADLDNDGDMDMILTSTWSLSVGSREDGTSFNRRMGKVRYFEHMNGDHNPPWTLTERLNEENPFHEISDNFILCMNCELSNVTCMAGCSNHKDDVSSSERKVFPFSYLTVHMIDLDNDDDMDVVFGTPRGVVLYYKNMGNKSLPNYEAMNGAVDNPFSNIIVDHGAPAFVDADGDGDLDLVLGSGTGVLFYFERVSIDKYIPRTEASVNPFFSISSGGRSQPMFVDITGDGVLDLVLASYDGKVILFQTLVVQLILRILKIVEAIHFLA